MYTYRKIMVFLVALATVFSAVLSDTPYNFFGKPLAHAAEVSEYLKKSLTTVETDAIRVAFFLEKIRTCYYAHLDKIESAMPYWEWAKHNPNAYVLSQLPHKWFKGAATLAVVDSTYTMILGLRDVYSAEFGAIIRLLAAWHEEKVDPELWLAEVQNVMASLLSCTIKDLAETDVLIQKVSVHEQHVAEMVKKVQAPSYIERHWIPLAVTTVAVGAAAYAYMHNKQTVDTFCKNSLKTTKENFKTNCYDPVKSFISGIVRDKEELYPVNLPGQLDKDGKPIVVLMKRQDVVEKYREFYNAAHAKNNKGIDSFGELVSDGQKPGSAWSVSSPVQSTIDQFINFFREKLGIAGKGAQHMSEGVQDCAGAGYILAQILEHDEKRIIERTDFIIQLFSLVPAYLVVKGSYSGISTIFNWFTKGDRRLLRLRLNQVEEVLIRTTHQRELSDAEYGRLLYLLTKEYDQVAKNVFSDERIAFLDDLTYLADTQSSIVQKQKKLDSMWRKYRSLAKSV